ncbi:MAG: transposase, partial [Bacteroidales bacterium]|nr:transposase [Bacteroidales bacterium]
VQGIPCKTFSQNPDADILKQNLSKNYPNRNCHSAYEAGFCGFSPHRELINQGIDNIVINPADVPTSDKERKQKEDRRDSRKITRSLHYA